MARVISIKNPSEGSHFRVIDSPGGKPRPPRPPKPPKTKVPKTPKGNVYAVPGGMMIHGQLYKDPTGGQWAKGMGTKKKKEKSYIGTPINTPFGSQVVTHALAPNYNVMTRQQFYQMRFMNTPLWVAFYDIARGVDPESGQQIAPSGTPGQQKPSDFTHLADSAEAAGRHKFDKQGNLLDPTKTGGQRHTPTAYWGPPDDAVYDAYVKKVKGK